MTLLLSAALAGLVAIAVTVAIERFGGVLGGFLGTLPTTIVPAALGIWAESADEASFRAAMAAVPVGMLVDTAFLYSWRALPPRLPTATFAARLATMIVLSLAAWATVAALALGAMAALTDAAVAPMAIGWAALGMLVAVGVAACLAPLPAPKGTRRVGPVALLSRGVLAAVAIAVSVALASLGSPLLAGIASVFPAIFLTTMVSLWLAQGEAVPTGAVGPMMLGSSAVCAFALLAAWTIPLWGPVVGAAVAWVAAVATCTVPATLWLRRRRARTAALPT